MSLLLLNDTQQVIELGNIASAEAFGTPTITQQTPAQPGSQVWPWYWVQQPRDILKPVQLPEPEPEAEPHRLAAAGGIRSAEAFSAPVLTLAIAAAGGIATSEEFGEPTVKRRRLRAVRQAEEMALLMRRAA